MSIRIMAKKSYHFHKPNDQSGKIPNSANPQGIVWVRLNEVVDVPDWVATDAMFQMAVKNGNIVQLVVPVTSTGIDNATTVTAASDTVTQAESLGIDVSAAKKKK